MKPIMMLEKHFTNKFSAIINLHQTMNVCVIDLKLVQGGFLLKSRMMSVNVVNSILYHSVKFTQAVFRT